MKLKPSARTIHVASAVILAVTFVGGVIGLLTASWRIVAASVLLLVALSSATVLWISVTIRRLNQGGERRAEERYSRMKRGIAAEIHETRRKQSRHEYQQGIVLARIQRTVSTVRGDVEGLTWNAFGTHRMLESQAARPRILFVTSNGAGLGHLTRCAAVAIAGASMFDSHVLSLSSAVPAMDRLGLDWSYYPSQQAQEVSWETWHRRFGRHMHATLSSAPYDAVVFDGTWMYRGLTEVCGRFGVPLVWMLRGNWKATADTSQLDDISAHCDAVVRPGDVADRRAAVSSGVPVFDTEPVVISDVVDVVGREEACAQLGLPVDRQYVLLQLGAGVVNDIAAAQDAVVRAVARIGPNWDVVVGRSALSNARLETSDKVHVVEKYPLATYMAAFEFAVIAAGYNSIHEVLHAGTPAIVWPNAETIADWQEQRALAVQNNGSGVVVTSVGQLREAVEQFADPARRAELAHSARKLLARGGARRAASAIDSIVQTAKKEREFTP